jgi:dual specificity tyrosine-phosphorylation-regulated kinase 2/3/4
MDTGRRRSYHGHLTRFEQLEIAHYDANDIYYVGKAISKPKHLHEASVTPTGLKSKFTDDKGHYYILPGDHVQYRYEMLRFIGNGSFGSVYKCRDHRTQELVALKICTKRNSLHVEAKHETSMMEYLQNECPPHDGIARMIDFFRFRGHVVIVTELLGLDLFEHCRALSFRGCSASFVKYIGFQVFDTLRHLHANNVVHCDVKPENLLLSGLGSAKVKLIDFGSSCFVHRQVFGYVQSRYYRAPEVLLGIPYGSEIDVWSLACVLFELAMGKPLFAGKTQGQQLAVIASLLGPVPMHMVDASSRRDSLFASGTNQLVDACLPDRAGLYRLYQPGARLEDLVAPPHSAKFVDLLAQCLVWDPARRLTAEEALRHPFFGNFYMYYDAVWHSPKSHRGGAVDVE